MRLYKPATSLTNLILTAQCMIYFFAIKACAENHNIIWARAFFLFSALGFAAGFVYHGIYNDSLATKNERLASFLIRFFSLLSVLPLGLVIGQISFTSEWLIYWNVFWTLIVSTFLVYFSYYFFVYDQSKSFMGVSLCMTLALILGSFGSIRDYGQTGESAYLILLLAFLLTIVAGLQQGLKIAIDKRYFDHNALYHVITIAALYFFNWGLCRVV